MDKDNELIYEAYVTEGGWSTAGHVTLDLLGLIPGWGEIADVTNAAWYASKKEYLMAALSLISVIPTIGDAVGKGGKLAVYAAKGAKAVKGAGTAGRSAAKGIVKGTQAVRKGTAAVSPHIVKAKNVIKSNKPLIDEVFTRAEQNEKLAPHVQGMKDALAAFTGEAPHQPQQPQV